MRALVRSVVAGVAVLGTLTGAARPGSAAGPGPGVVAAHLVLSAPPKRVLGGGHTGPIVAAAFPRGGKELLTAGGEAAVVRWDVATGEALGTLKLRLGPNCVFPNYPGGSAFTPDGSRLVAAIRDGAVGAYDAATGAERVVRDFPDDLTPNGDVRVAVSATGASAVAVFPAWENNTTGLALVTAGLGPGVPTVGRVFAGPGRQRWSSAAAAALTPDGSKAVVARITRVARSYRCELTAVSAATGATLTRTDFPFGNHALAVAAAPDNRSVAVAGPDGRLVLWDSATGRPRVLFDVTPLGYAPPAFAADGRTLAVLTGTSLDGRTRYEDYRIRVLEVATGGVRYELTPGEYVNAVAIAADGSAVAAGLRTKVALAWDLSPTAGPWPWGKCGSDPDRLWAAVATGTAGQAWPAMREMIARPGVAVPLIRAKVKPAPAPGKPAADALAKLIRQLDAPKFADRRAAEAALRALGPLVADDLRAALKATKSAEARDQIEGLLALLDHLPPVNRAEARAVEVLERIGTPAAKAVLAAYAAGPEHTALTTDAKAALVRLK